MLFAIRYHFKDGIEEAREEARPAHIEYIKNAGTRLKVGGPLSHPAAGDAPAKPRGSLLILDADSLTAAQLFAQNDPYYKAEIIADVDVTAFKSVLGAWTL